MNTTANLQLQRSLQSARSGDGEQLGSLLETYRNYLAILAATQIGEPLRRRLSPSDIVQEAMLAACRDFRQFRGNSEREFLSWLRKILVNSVHRAVEIHLRAKRRDARREVSFEQFAQDVDRSSQRLLNGVADRGPSPSAAARQKESVVELANQLAKLPADYREVIILRNLRGLSFDEVARPMCRSPGAVRMLWLRAIDRFRELYAKRKS